MPPKAKKKNVIPAKSKKNSFIKELIIGLVLLTVIVTPFIYNLESRRFHHDENHWIYSAKYFKLFFIDRDFHNQQWNEWWTYDQPSVGRYIIGLSLYIDGHDDRFKEIGNMSVWNPSHHYYWNVFNGALPLKDILYTARLPMAILGGLTCFLIYLAGIMIFNRWAGILGALLLAYNPLMLESCQRAMTEAPLVFFLMANIVLIIFFHRSLMKQKYYRVLGLSFFIGFNIALATGTKLNGALAGIIFGTFCVFFTAMKVYAHVKNKTPQSLLHRILTDMDIKTVLSGLVISGLTAIILFTALNPYLYGHPIKGYRKMIESRIEAIKDQQKRFALIDTFGEKFRFVSNRSLYDEHYTTLKSRLRVPLDLILFVVGLSVLVYTEVKYAIENGTLSAKSIVIMWTFITYLGTIAWIPFDWNRYYLPPVPCVAVVSGYFSESVLSRIYNFTMARIKT